MLFQHSGQKLRILYNCDNSEFEFSPIFIWKSKTWVCENSRAITRRLNEIVQKWMKKDSHTHTHQTHMAKETLSTKMKDKKTMTEKMEKEKRQREKERNWHNRARKNAKPHTFIVHTDKFVDDSENVYIFYSGYIEQNVWWDKMRLWLFVHVVNILLSYFSLSLSVRSIIINMV